MGKALEYLENIADRELSYLLSQKVRMIIENLSDDEFIALEHATQECAGGYDPGIDASITRTTDTLSDFINARDNTWLMPGEMACLYVRGALRRKEELRSRIVIMDMGDYRLVIR